MEKNSEIKRIRRDSPARWTGVIPSLAISCLVLRVVVTVNASFKSNQFWSLRSTMSGGDI